MRLDRSHLVLAAAVGFAVLAVVEVLRGDEPEPAPVEVPLAAPSSPAVSAPPPERSAGETTRLRMLHVEGRVTTARGRPLPGARISVHGGSVEQTSDASGAYRLSVALGDSEPPRLLFSASGYQDAVRPLEPAPGVGPVRLDVRLEPAAGAVVSGTLGDERGSPIAGETIQLVASASGVRHAGVSDAQGAFEMPGVEPGSGYYLFVRPEAGYRDFQRPLDVGPDGVTLEIALQELSTARLSGRLVDVQGGPVPNLPFSVVSGQALGRSLPARTDADGYFSLEDVPTGHLSFLTDPPERLVLGGWNLAPGSDGEVLLRVDWGDAGLAGRVVDDAGQPLGGAHVELSWSHVSEDSAGRSTRSVVTDARGSFEFRRLGPGIHRLEVRAPGFREVELDYDVTPDARGVVVELESARGTG